MNYIGGVGATMLSNSHFNWNFNWNFNSRDFSVESTYRIAALSSIGVISIGLMIGNKRVMAGGATACLASISLPLLFNYIDGKKSTNRVAIQDDTTKNGNTQSNNNAQEIDVNIREPNLTWKEPCTYDDMRTRADIKTAPIVPGYIEEGLINGILGGAGVAKSMLIRQLALAIATGGDVSILPDTKVRKMDVLFYRLEEFAGEEEGKYGRGDIFTKAGIMWRTKSDFENFTQQEVVNDLIQIALRIENDTVAFIDPITKFSDYNIEKFVNGAEYAMSTAKEKGHTLTIVISAHLDEQEPWKPVTSVNIRGGDRLVQLLGAVSAICRERTDSGHRFLMCLKAPKGYPEPSDVVVCKIEKQIIDEHNWNTKLSYVCKKKLENALPLKPKSTVENDTENIMPHPKSNDYEMLNKALMAEKTKKEERLTDEELALKFNVSRQTISNWRKFLEEWRKNHPNEIEGVK